MRTSTDSAWARWPRAVSATVDAGRLVVELRDGRTIGIPVRDIDFLVGRTPEECRGLEILGGGEGIWWEALDDGVSVPGLLGLPEIPPPDPRVRSYAIAYHEDDGFWVAEVEGTELRTFGRSLTAAKQRVRALLRGYLGVSNLKIADIRILDRVPSPEPVEAS
jgi:hypothetical protein